MPSASSTPLTIKVPALTIIFVIAMFQLLTATFVGGQDKRTLFGHIVGLIILASIVFYTDQLVRWISNFIGR